MIVTHHHSNYYLLLQAMPRRPTAWRGLGRCTQSSHRACVNLAVGICIRTAV